ncbi:WbuC family cupin fold metalloprotein [Candidatus Levibacter sp. Uisw_134_01]|uniref:WbuC family cupin fold metalloprotein n=1 Tax=Candidatus Levibacter sp. Uisw_134_01 TaxID=3230999 RepID=UPI003D452756
MFNFRERISMSTKFFNLEFLNKLSVDAKKNRRKRQHFNLHESFKDPCQRLFNAIEPGSYIRPHRHAFDPRDELLIAVRGLMVLVLFDDLGNLTQIFPFGINKNKRKYAIGAEVSAKDWHTVIALQEGCVLIEVKAGPFNSELPKELAPWAPNETSPDAKSYLENLLARVNNFNLK